MADDSSWGHIVFCVGSYESSILFAGGAHRFGRDGHYAEDAQQHVMGPEGRMIGMIGMICVCVTCLRGWMLW